MSIPVIPTGATGRYQSRNVAVIEGNAALPGWTTEPSTTVSIEFTPRRPGRPARDIITAYAHDVTVSA